MSEPTKNRIEAVLTAQFGATYAGADIDSRLDHDGDPAIYIRVRFRPSDAIPASAKVIDAAVALRDSLLSAEDDRFPYLRPVYPEDPVSGEAA